MRRCSKLWPKKSTTADTGPSPACRSGSPNTTRSRYPNKPSGTAWTSSTIHTKERVPTPLREIGSVRRRLKRGARPVPGAGEKQAIRTLLQRRNALRAHIELQEKLVKSGRAHDHRKPAVLR